MAKAKKYTLAAGLIIFCLFLSLLILANQIAWPQEDENIPEEWQFKGALAALRDQIIGVRVSAIDYLNNLKLLNRLSKKDIKYISVMLTDSDPKARSIALFALGELGKMSLDYIRQITACLEDSNHEVRSDAVWAFLRLSDIYKDYIPLIAGRLEDAHPEVRRDTVNAIGWWGKVPPEYIPIIAHCLEDPNPEVRRAALRTLGQLGGGIGHQMRNSVTGCRMALELHLRECPLPFYPWLRQIAWQRIAHLHAQHLESDKRSVLRECEMALPTPDFSRIELAKQLKKECQFFVQRALLDYLIVDEEKHDQLLQALEDFKKNLYPYG